MRISRAGPPGSQWARWRQEFEDRRLREFRSAAKTAVHPVERRHQVVDCRGRNRFRYRAARRDCLAGAFEVVPDRCRAVEDAFTVRNPGIVDGLEDIGESGHATLSARGPIGAAIEWDARQASGTH